MKRFRGSVKACSPVVLVIALFGPSLSCENNDPPGPTPTCTIDPTLPRYDWTSSATNEVVLRTTPENESPNIFELSVNAPAGIRWVSIDGFTPDMSHDLLDIDGPITLGFDCDAGTVDATLVLTVTESFGSVIYGSASHELLVDCSEFVPAPVLTVADLIVNTEDQGVWVPTPDRGTAVNLDNFTAETAAEHFPLGSSCTAFAGVDNLTHASMPPLSVDSDVQVFSFELINFVYESVGLIAGPFLGPLSQYVVTQGTTPISYDAPINSYDDIKVVTVSGSTRIDLHTASELPPEAVLIAILTWDGGRSGMECEVLASDFVSDGSGGQDVSIDLGTVPSQFTETFVNQILAGVFTQAEQQSPDYESPLLVRGGTFTRFDADAPFVLWDDGIAPADLIPTPTTAELNSLGQPRVALCQDSFGTFSFETNPAGVCPFVPPGTTVGPFFMFTGGDPDLTVTAGQTLGGAAAVEIISTTGGTLVDGAPDVITGVLPGVSTTITTSNHSLTFSHNGTSVTITAFTAL